MPTQQTTYNSRLTDEALERKFRDTFRSQGGAELVDDLYASGVIVPVVDFTAAAEGSALRQDLQRAWDFSTGATSIYNSTVDVISNAGFWHVQFAADVNFAATGSQLVIVSIFDGSSSKTIFEFDEGLTDVTENFILKHDFDVFLRSNDVLRIQTTSGINLWATYRQIADLYGALQQPAGYVSQ
jgi:hypothetical protein